MKNERGMGLIEILISIAILGIITAAFFTVLSTASKAVAVAERKEKGRNLAENQMEYIMGKAYNGTTVNNSAATYRPSTPLPASYAGYVVNVTTTLLADNTSSGTTPSNRQQITVNVSQNSTVIATLQGYKVKR